MLIPMLIERPQIIGPVLRGTPGWVWALLAGLIVLGVTQMRDRQASLARVTFMPFAMTAFALWGLTGAFGKAPGYGWAILAWALVAAATFATIGVTRAPQGSTYDANERRFFLPGSAVPLALIMAIFLTRYVVNVDLAMQPSLALDAMYTLVVSGIYGLSSGIFLGRAARLWRRAANNSGIRFLMQRDPW